MKTGARLAVLILALVVIAVWPGARTARGGGLATRGLKIGAAGLRVEVARTLGERYRGLSWREKLPPGRGMAFVFPGPRAVAMTMRGMRFDLDFIWCRKNRVVKVDHRVSRLGGPQALINSPGVVDLVVEVPAGWARAHGVLPGQKAIWDRP